MYSRRFLRLAIVSALLFAVITIYVTFFRHPPADKLMEMNSGGAKDFAANFLSGEAVVRGNDGGVAKKSPEDEDDKRRKEKDDGNPLAVFLDREYGPNDDMDENKNSQKAGPTKRPEWKPQDRGVKGKTQWDAFVRNNNYTPVGVVYDRCVNQTVQLGTIVLLADEENGGVKTRAFYNLTLEKDMKGGTFNIEVKYNGQDLYDNWWEICEMEDDLEPEKRTFICPIRKGFVSLVKDKHIPDYLPEGRYLSKAWVKNEDGDLLACGYSDLTL